MEAATPHGSRYGTPYSQPPGVWLLEELIWCLLCSRQMQPAPRVDGTRFYSCGLDCPQPDLLAIRVEQDLLLPAMVRAHQVLYGVGSLGTLVVSREELRRWHQTDPRDHRAMLLAAYVRVTVDAEGNVTAVWRHAEEAATSEAAGARHR